MSSASQQKCPVYESFDLNYKVLISFKLLRFTFLHSFYLFQLFCAVRGVGGF